jgi:predicted NUDIX family phosphoesterase
MSKERVLVVPTNLVLEKGTSMKYSDFSDIISKSAIYIDRDVAEKDENYLQIIPYCIIYRYTSRMQEPSIFLYQRLKGGSEARLHAKYSIGIGGHINDDLDGDSINSSTISRAAYREVSEEIGNKFIYPPAVSSTEFLIYDPSNEVGRVHLGVLMKALSRTDFLEPLEIEKISGRMVPLSKIISDYSDKLENWSKRAIELCFTKII